MLAKLHKLSQYWQNPLVFSPFVKVRSTRDILDTSGLPPAPVADGPVVFDTSTLEPEFIKYDLTLQYRLYQRYSDMVEPPNTENVLRNMDLS